MAAAVAPGPASVDAAHQRWEAAMGAEIERIRSDVRLLSPPDVAERVAGSWSQELLRIEYWGESVSIGWPELVARSGDGSALSAFDQAMLLYHLRLSDGSVPTGRWISYRELPGGEFYHQAYQGYTGRRLAAAFGDDPLRFDEAAVGWHGARVDGPSPHTWRFTPLTRLPLAACLWPGDEEMPAQASVLFDACAPHHLPIDGLALLGAGLTGRLLRVVVSKR